MAMLLFQLSQSQVVKSSKLDTEEVLGQDQGQEQPPQDDFHCW